MSACIALFYLSAAVVQTASVGQIAARVVPHAAHRQPAPPAGAAPSAEAPPDPADALYAEREDPAKARRAVEVWRRTLASNPQAFDAAWKLARAMYGLGGRGERDARRADLEEGVAAGRRAAAIEPGRPEGHFWMAANMGALAESFGLRQGLRYRGPIKDALERVLVIDAAFQQGSADRALGRWYFRVPRLFGGSRDKAEAHLRRSLTYNPDSTASLYFLAEVLLADDRPDEARELLVRCLAVRPHPEWVPEDREFKAKAQALLASF
jgi:tetratricopeptide (TPR) repeat protein